MARKSDIEQQLQAMITRGSVPDSMRIASALSTIPAAIEKRKERQAIDYSEEQSTLNKFDSRLNTPMLSAFSDSTVYDNKTIDELEANLTRIKNEDMGRFPDQSVDFIDIYDRKINKLKEYRSLNNHYNHYVSKMPEAEQFLLGMTDDLTSITWEQLTPKKKREIKDKLFDGTQQIAEFSKFMENNKDYFNNNKSFNTNKDNVDIGMIGGYNQLLAQINTLDPSGTIINEDEQRMMINSIRHKRPEEIIQRNETIARVADKRVMGYQDKFDTAHAQHITNTAMMNSPDFKMEAARVDAEFNKFNEDLKSKLANGKITDAEYASKLSTYFKNPSSWQGQVGDKLVNIMQTRTDQTALEQAMLAADTNFEKETGSKYSAWMGKSTPWMETRDDNILTGKQKSNLVSLGYNEGDIGSMGYEPALDIIKKQTKKTIVPSISLEEEKKKISESTSVGVKETGTKVINELAELDKKIADLKTKVAGLETKFTALETRKGVVDKELEDLKEAFPKVRQETFPYSEVSDMPKDIREKYRDLQKESRDLKEKTKTIGSEAYVLSGQKQIDEWNKVIDKLGKERTSKKSRLDQLIKVR